MADEVKDTKQPEVETAPASPVKETSKKRNATKPKAQKQVKEDAPAMLKAAGRDACKLHKLEHVWVTDDGQCFPIEGDAKAHAANLTNKELIKVMAE